MQEPGVRDPHLLAAIMLGTGEVSVGDS
jgi:hypothetical protein